MTQAITMAAPAAAKRSAIAPLILASEPEITATCLLREVEALIKVLSSYVEAAFLLEQLAIVLVLSALSYAQSLV
jgi:hypothetical protein